MTSTDLGKTLVEIAGIASAAAGPLVDGKGPLAVNITNAVGTFSAIILKILAAHESVTGQPIDPSTLKPYTPAP